MKDDARQYLTCPYCGNETPRPSISPFIQFPDDEETLFSLFDGTYNSVFCQTCTKKLTYLTFVIAVNAPSQQVVVCEPFENEATRAKLRADTPGDMTITFVKDYNELIDALLPWLNPQIKPLLESLFDDTFEKKSRQEQIVLCTPFSLRAMKMLLDKDIPFITTSGSKQDHMDFSRAIFTGLVSDHIQRLGLEAARLRQILELPEKLREHIPAACITEGVLESVSERCSPFAEAFKRFDDDPMNLMYAYRQEYIHALACHLGGMNNPRLREWANYVVAFWILKLIPGAHIDDQFFLTAQIVQDTVGFPALYNAAITEFGIASWAGSDKPDRDEISTTLEGVADMMAFYGYEATFMTTAQNSLFQIRNPDVLTKEQRQRLARFHRENIAQENAFNQSNEDSWGIGVHAASTVRHFLMQSFEEEAISLARDILQDARHAGDYVAQVSVVTRVVEVLNLFQLHSEAEGLINAVVEKVLNDNTKQQREISSYQAVAFLNEAGNCSRYAQNFDKAIAYYEQAEGIIESASDMPEDKKAADRSVLHRNLAIVYRDSGQYSKALNMLEAQRAQEPDSDAVYHSIALVYDHLNRYGEAIQALDRAVSLASNRIDPVWLGRYLMHRGYIKQKAGGPSEGLIDVMAGFNLLPKEASALRVYGAVAALSFYPKDDDVEGQRFVAECEANALAYLQNEQITPSLLTTIITQVGIRRLTLRQPQAAMELLLPYLPRQRDKINTPWQFDFAMCWALFESEDYENCEYYLLHTLDKLESHVPDEDEAATAPFWMQDKEIIQTKLASICVRLVSLDIVTVELLLPIYEMMNGREITARLRRHLIEDERPLIAAIRTTMEAFASRVAASRSAEVFFFIDTEDTVEIAYLSSATLEFALVADASLRQDEIRDAKKEFSQALKWANPTDPGSLDAHIPLWMAVAAKIGQAISIHLRPGSHICLLPGRALTGMPLHLVPIGDGRTLLEDYSVSFAPNLATFALGLNEPSAQTKEGVTIVTVTKAADTPAFKQRAAEASERIATALPTGMTITALNEIDAAKPIVLSAMGRCREIVFICHGTTAGPQQGYGICLAHDGLLPPRILAVQEQPAHAQFIMTWEDIQGSPPIFVSIACSSGITQVAQGGVRFGLEQSLFTSGTRVMISPIWDIQQEAALLWLESFYRLRQQQQSLPIEQAFRMACLAVKEQYPHFFHWGAFILNGSVL